jgi:hypothetical protein
VELKYKIKNMKQIKTLLRLFTSILIGYGLWYIIFYFITSNVNPLEWNIATKLVYLGFGLITTSKLEDDLK